MTGCNLLSAELTCPRCSHTGESEVEFRFGLLDFRRYTVWEEGGPRAMIETCRSV
jgi:hypothetical protein